MEDRISEYEPVDLSGLSNGTLDVRTGDVALRGLPFRVSVVLVEPSRPVTVPVGRTARTIVFAHRMLDQAANGWGAGRLVAEYVVRLAGGREVVVPVRERFEIQGHPVHWGANPFAALPDTLDRMQARHQGPWGSAGERQAEVERGWMRDWWLFAWTNPSPESVVESIELRAIGSRIGLGGITTGRVDEWPFVRTGPVDVRVTIDGDAPKDLSVGVDRGIATYTHALPDSGVEAFLGDALKGFGEERASGHVAHVRVAATPSATVTVLDGDRELGSVRWSDVEVGAGTTAGARVELIDRGRNWVHVTVLDEHTGRPVPCRVHFRSPEGVPYQPHGHHDHVNSGLPTWHIDIGGDVRLGRVTYAVIDGRCQGWLPRGDVVVDVARGFEYEPLRTIVRIEPGQRELTLRLRRWIDMSARGWYSGDTHVHFLSTVGSQREQQAEDLNVVNLLQSQWGSLFTNTEEFTGKPAIVGDGPYITWVGQENRQHLMGHLSLLGLREPVMPWCSDGPDEAEIGGTLEATLAEWADRCHAQGGTVIMPHFPAPNGEPAVLVSTGRADGVEFLVQERANHDEYYRYLNAGYRLPIVGGTDKMESDVPVGLYRTYALVRDGFSFESWCAAVREGRTFMSGGPLLSLRVDGHDVGDTVAMTGPGTVEVEAWAESIFPIGVLEIVRNGEVVASASGPASAEGGRRSSRRIELRDRVQVDGHSWIAARCGGPGYFDAPLHRDTWHRAAFAHTSPVYIACGGDWWMFDEAATQYMTTLVDGGLTYIDRVAAQYPEGSVTHHHGEPDHRAWLERPFRQARDALEKRLRERR